MTILPIVHIVVAVLLVVAILLQRSGIGLDGALGGGSSDTSITTTRRGAEKFLLYATIVLGILFVGIALAAVVIQ